MYRSIDVFFADIEKSTPNYHSIINLQQEWLQTCENTIKSMISAQQELVTKVDMDTAIPGTFLQLIGKTNDQMLSFYSIQTQAALAAIDATRQNIKEFNNKAEFFADVNKNTAKYWTFLFV